MADVYVSFCRDGEPVESLSLKYHCVEEGPGGNDCFVASTYQNIVACIAKPLLDQGLVKLNQPIRSITRNPDVETHRITVELAGGSKVAYDEAVVTCPLGWLKQHQKTFFTPPLPPKLSKAIENTGFVDSTRKFGPYANDVADMAGLKSST